MHENEVPGIEYKSTKPTLLSFFKKLAIRLHLLQEDSGIAGANAEKRITVQSETDKVMDKHGNMINLMNQGKKYEEAEHIASVAKDYHIDISKIDADKIKVTGKSVWINLED